MFFGPQLKINTPETPKRSTGIQANSFLTTACPAKTSIILIVVSIGLAETSTGAPKISSGRVEISTSAPEISLGDVEIPAGAPEISSGNVEIPTSAPEISLGHVEIPTGAPEISSGDVESSTGVFLPLAAVLSCNGGAFLNQDNDQAFCIEPGISIFL